MRRRTSCSATTATARSPTSPRGRPARRRAAGHRHRADRLRQPARHRPARRSGRRSRPRLFKNMRDGSFRDVAADAGLPAAASYSALAAADVNKDGRTDFLFGRADARRHARDERRPRAASRRPADRTSPAGVTVAQFVDYDNDGLLDLFTAHAQVGAAVEESSGDAGRTSERPAGCSRLAASLDCRHRFGRVRRSRRDGDLDALVLLANGELRCWRNDGGSTRKVAPGAALQGRVSNRGGVARKWSCAPAACGSARNVRGDAGARPARGRVRPRAARRRRTSCASSGPPARSRRRPSAGSGAGHRQRARSQALVVPVPLHVERLAIRVRDRLHGRRRNRLLDAPGRVEHTRSRRVRPDPSRPPSADAAAGTSSASPTSSKRRCSSITCSSWRSITTRTSTCSRTRGSARAGVGTFSADDGARPRVRPVAAVDEHGRDVLSRLERLDRAVR